MKKPEQGGLQAEEFSAWDDFKYSLAIFAFWLAPIALIGWLVVSVL